MLYILDYGAGNVRSLANSVRKLGFEFEWVKNPSDLDKADKLLFPGVGAFGQALTSLRRQGYAESLKAYIASGKPFMGICIGLQALFEGSDESPGVPGLGVIPGRVGKFTAQDTSMSAGHKSVPHMGWNDARLLKGGDEAVVYGLTKASSYYFVHSYRVAYDPDVHAPWALSTTQYGGELFLSSVQRENVFATQFHPEKSGQAGLNVLHAWLSQSGVVDERAVSTRAPTLAHKAEALLKPVDGFRKRIVACLDVRTNDDGDLVVTKGDQYDVRERESLSALTTSTASVPGQRNVRNLGKPVDLALRYYLSGADEIVLLNITSFRSCPLHDQPMLAVTSHAAANIYVPLCIGGGIRDTVDPDGTKRSALEVAEAYFRAGADKVSIGGDAVLAVEDMLAREAKGAPALTGTTGIETISAAYGAQAVVVSIDPKRVYLDSPDDCPPVHRRSLISGRPGTPDEGRHWWYQCTIKGGRETRDLDVVQLAEGVERLGAGELLVNSIDKDGSNSGFDLQLIGLVKRSASIPVVASSGAGKPEHFSEVFGVTEEQRRGTESPEAALAAGIFHREEVTIADVKAHLREAGCAVREDLVQKTDGVVGA